MNKVIRDLLTTDAQLRLHQLLQSHSLQLNPNALLPNPERNIPPPTSVELLSDLEGRLRRFEAFDFKREQSLKIQEEHSGLYEYLEGVLLKGVGRPADAPFTESIATGLAVYDFRKLDDWEDLDDEGSGGEGDQMETVEEEEIMEETTESEVGRSIRTYKRFPFNISEFAVDPGQDLLVVVEACDVG